MSNNVTIYALRDPRTNAVRYIGQTRNIDQRVREHMHHAGKARQLVTHWLMDLKTSGIVPDVELLGVADSQADADALEAEAIARMRIIGAPLLNVASGGLHVRGPMTEDGRRKISESKRGIPRPDVAIRMRNRVVSQETKDKISAAAKGRIPSAESNSKRSESLKRAYAEGRKKYVAPRRAPQTVI